MSSSRALVLLPFLLLAFAPTSRAEDDGQEAPAREARVLAPSWKDQGAAAYAEKDFAQAIYLYRRWLEAGPRDRETWYNLACCYALAGFPEKALEALDTAVDAGWDDASWPKEDPDLASVREDARFQATMERASKRESPDAPSSFERHYFVQQTLGTYVAMPPPDYGTTDRSYPLVVILHGNGSSELRHGRLADAVGRDGVIYVAPRAPYPHPGVFRTGEAGWTSRPADADPEEIASFDAGVMYVDTILAAVKDARTRYRVAGERFFVLGHSMGGFFANVLAVLHPDLVASYFAYAGGLPEPYRTRALARLVEEGVHVVLAHGNADPVVDVESSKEAYAALKAAGADVTLLLFDDQDHGVGPAVREAMKAWVDESVRGEEAKAEATTPTSD